MKRIDWVLLLLLCSVVLAFLLIFANAARAAEPHSVPWFEQNIALRHEALRICRNDHRTAQGKRTGKICNNAEAAEARVYADTQSAGLRAMERPEWWSMNAPMRAAALVACERRAPYDRSFLPYCDAARKSAGVM